MREGGKEQNFKARKKETIDNKIIANARVHVAWDEGENVKGREEKEN